MKKWVSFILGLIAAMMWILGGFADGESVTIAQVFQEKEDNSRLHVRMEAVDGKGSSIGYLTKDTIQEASIGTGTVPVLSITNVSDPKFEGMHYIFVLDHAMRIGSNRIKELKSGMGRWIDAMGAKDYVAIFVNEAEEIRNLTNGFTNDKQALKDAMENYGRANESGSSKSQLYASIRDAIQLAEGIMPAHCSIIVCSDGRDTYQTVVTLDDLAKQLSNHNLPLYVVGFAYTSQKPELAKLVNLAKNSGGWTEDATPTNNQATIDEAFDRLRGRIMGAYDVVLDCSDGFVFNGPTQLSLRFDFLPQPVKRTADLYRLKAQESDKATTRPTAKPASSGNGADDGQSNSGIWGNDGSESITIGGRSFSKQTLLLFGAGVLCIIILITLMARNTRRRRKKEMPTEEEESPDQANSYRDGPTVKVSMAPPMMDAEVGQTVKVSGVEDRPLPQQSWIQGAETKPLQIGTYQPPAQACSVEVLTIRYQLPGQEEQAKVFPKPTTIFIGREVAENQLRIHYESISRKHARIECKGGKVYIENISEALPGQGQNPIFVNDTQIGNGPVELSPCAKLNMGLLPFVVDWSFEDPDKTVRPKPYDPDATVRPTLEDPDQTVREMPIRIRVGYTLPGQAEKTEVVALRQEAVIGRGKKDDVCIPDESKSVSRGHIKLLRQGNYIRVENASDDKPGAGKNPFYVKGSEILDSVDFEDGMVLVIGGVTVTLSIVQ